MGMTIDEAIHDTEIMKEYLEYRDEPRSEGLGVAIDTMRKYQKITKIAKAHKNGATGLACMNEICEVIEDGNDKTGC